MNSLNEMLSTVDQSFIYENEQLQHNSLITCRKYKIKVNIQRNTKSIQIKISSPLNIQTDYTKVKQIQELNI